ncbi:MAG: LacI family DNA-binding transcriptional regulator [Acidobacteria bacterium]|nr:LacI family DNA-binding transcriptional regulator [Acidobacteriota bacterium]
MKAPNKRSATTISDIARLSGVSKRTVSRVLNHSPKVGGETRDKVQKVIDELRFKPNLQARGLAARRSYFLGMIYDNPDALYIDEVQRGVLSVCREFGYELVVHPCDRASDTLTAEAIAFVDRSKLDGVIVLPPVSEDNDLAGALGKDDVPYVRLAAIALDTADHVVVSNERSAVAAMAEYLVELGHRRIGYVAGPEGRKSTRERLEGFCEALAKHGCSPCEEMIQRGAYSFESGRVCGKALLEMTPPPTAIFASNDEMAAGVIVAAQDMGLRVPEDVSVAGFDDSALATRIRPSLTTIRRPVREMARLATAKLIAAIDGREAEARMGIFLDPELVVRDSTRPLRAAAESRKASAQGRRKGS